MPSLASRVLSGEEAISNELLHGRAENVNVEIDGRVLRLSNLNKVYFPESGYTKRDLLASFTHLKSSCPFGRPLWYYAVIPTALQENLSWDAVKRRRNG
jgi:hypothetical protein